MTYFEFHFYSYSTNLDANECFIAFSQSFSHFYYLFNQFFGESFSIICFLSGYFCCLSLLLKHSNILDISHDYLMDMHIIHVQPYTASIPGV